MSHHDAVEEVVSGRVIEAATGRLIAQEHTIAVRGRSPACKGFVAFDAAESWFTPDDVFHLIAGDGRTIAFNLFKLLGRPWVGVILSDEPAPGS